MTNDQLDDLLTSGDNTQISQAIAYFEKQKQISKDLLTACFIAWQLVEESILRKRLLNLFKKYTPIAFQHFLKSKYLLKNQLQPKKIKEQLQEMEISQLIDIQKFIFYLFPYFPKFLWLHMQEKLTKNQKDIVFQNPKIKDVEVLHLNLNDISQLDLSYLSAATNLKHLDISFSYAKLEKLPIGIENLKSIEELDLGINNLYKVSFKPLASLPKLKRLRLHNCKFKNFPEGIENLIHLEALDLSLINLSQINFMPLTHLPKLKKIDLTLCELEKLPNGIEKLNALEELELNQNPSLTFSKLDKLARLPNLKKLHLHGCGYSFNPPPLSPALTALKEKGVELIMDNISKRFFEFSNF